MKRQLILYETEEPISAHRGKVWEVRCDQCFWYRTGSLRREGMICGRMESRSGDPIHPETLAYAEGRAVKVEPNFGCVMFTPKGGNS